MVRKIYSLVEQRVVTAKYSVFYGKSDFITTKTGDKHYKVVLSKTRKLSSFSIYDCVILAFRLFKSKLNGHLNPGRGF